MTDTDNKVAIFNTGQMNAMRIGNMLAQCNIESYNGNLHGWYKCTLILNREVSPKLNKKELEGAIELMNQVSKAAIEFNRSNENALSYKNKFSQFYNALNSFEVWLRQKLDSHGLGSPDRDDPSAIIGKG